MTSINHSISYNPSECPDEHLLMSYVHRSVDPNIRKQLDDHIDSCELCTEVLITLAELIEPEALPSTEDWKNQSIHHYELLELLGSGGMGAVYEAYDTILKRRIALKMLNPDIRKETSKEQVKARMLREARALASLSHPHILPVYEVGTWNEQIYITMQLVDGHNLRSWIVHQQPSWIEVIQLFIQILRGLDAAHMAGITHRDVKPDNILITHENHAYLADFGLVSITPKSNADLAHTLPSIGRLTASGTVVGTHGYIAPELYRGQPASSKSDQFSLCVALYEALYHQMPHISLPFHEHLKSIESGEIRIPLIDDPPEGYFALLQRGMHPIPHKRFQTLTELREEAERISHDEEQAVTRPERIAWSSQALSSMQELPKRTSQHPTVRRMFSLISGLAVGTAVLWALLYVLPQMSKSIISLTDTQNVSIRPIPQPQKSTKQVVAAAPVQPRHRQMTRAHSVATKVVHPQKIKKPKTASLKRAKRRRRIATYTQKRRAAVQHRARFKWKKKRKLALYRPNVRSTGRSKQGTYIPYDTRIPIKPRKRLRDKELTYWNQLKKGDVAHTRRKNAKILMHKRDSLSWWIHKLGESAGIRCRTAELAVRRYTSPHLTKHSKRFFYKYRSCLYRVSECNKGYQVDLRYIVRSRSRTHKQVFLNAIKECPMRAFVRTLRPKLEAQVKRIGTSYNADHVWCSRLLGRLESNKNAHTLRGAKERKLFSGMLQHIVQCYGRRYVHLTRRYKMYIKRRGCTRLYDLWNTIRTHFLYPQISKRYFFKHLPQCSNLH